MREPMLMLLAGGGIVYLLLGDLREALILLAFGMVSIIITVAQETRTERVLEALRDLTSPRALVIRDGQRKRIPGREVVRGDLIILSEGDRVPADAVLLRAADLLADESLLTGESVPVRKVPRTGNEADSRPGGDDLPFVYSGALIVRGTGVAEVTATGLRSEIGKIGQSLGALGTEPPKLRAETQRLVRMFAAVGGLVSAAAVLLYGLLRGGWLDALLAGIALGMSMLPEEFPVVLTVFMAMGAWRISRARVLTRRASAIETLGSATVLCTDKTGTLTVNRMSIDELRLPDGTVHVVRTNASPSAAHAELLRVGILASAPEPFDPMETAFHDLGNKWGLAASHGRTLLRSYGLRPDLLAVTQVWRDANAGLQVAVKGAPEAVALLCDADAEAMTQLKAAVDVMASAVCACSELRGGASSAKSCPTIRGNSLSPS
jgi:Ca2+-transporting ATPase